MIITSILAWQLSDKYLPMRRLSMGVAAIIVLAGLGVAGASGTAVASAAPCSGPKCAGLDPYTTGCSKYSGSKTENLDNYVQLAVMSSDGCNAKWAEAALSSSALAVGDRLVVSISTTDSLGIGEFMCYPGTSADGGSAETCDGFYGGPRGSAAVHTDMVDGTNAATADVEVYNGAGTVDLDSLKVSL
jgi:hypothetical protein